MMNKKISIIVPTLNQGQFIKQCLDSIVSQDYSELQLIIIDGGSTDKTTSIIKKYDKHISYWISEKDAGQSDAINKGLQKADGDIINWLNSDDYLEPGSLQIINKVFKDPSINVFSGRSNIVQEGIILKRSKGLDIYEGNLPKTIGMARIDQPETYWRKTVLDEIGPLNSNLRYIMDRDWWVKYLLMYGLNGILNTDDIIANFRLHDQSKTVSEHHAFNDERNAYFRNIASRYGLDVFNELKIEFNKLKVDFRKSFDVDIISQSINYFIFQLASEYYAQSDWKKFKLIYEQINFESLHPTDAKHLRKLNGRVSTIPSAVHQLIKKIR